MHATSTARAAATACFAAVLASFAGAHSYAQAGSQSFRLSLTELDAITAVNVHATLTTTAYAGSQRSTVEAWNSMRAVDHLANGESTSALATVSGSGTASTLPGKAVTASDNLVTVDAGSDVAVEVHAVTMGTAFGGYATSKSKTATEAKDGPKRDVVHGLASSSSVGDKADTTASAPFSIDGDLISIKSSTTESINDKKSLVTRTTSLYNPGPRVLSSDVNAGGSAQGVVPIPNPSEHTVMVDVLFARGNTHIGAPGRGLALPSSGPIVSSRAW